MFLATFRNTFKTLFRSMTFWLVAFVFCFIVLPKMFGDYQFADEWNYSEYVSNLIGGSIMPYAMPFFSITLVALTLNRDYGDGFYEIEKATGVKPSYYILGRISAIATIVLAFSAISSYICVYGYVIIYGDGGLANRSLSWLLVDSVLRLGAFNLFMVLPSILFYAGLTYLFGTLLQNGLAGAGVGFVHVIVYDIIYAICRHNPDFSVYFDFLSPIPRHLWHFLRFTYIEGGNRWLTMFETTAPKALICLCFLLGCAALFLLCSWLRLRKREI